MMKRVSCILSSFPLNCLILNSCSFMTFSSYWIYASNFCRSRKDYYFFYCSVAFVSLFFFYSFEYCFFNYYIFFWRMNFSFSKFVMWDSSCFIFISAYFSDETKAFYFPSDSALILMLLLSEDALLLWSEALIIYVTIFEESYCYY